jgi:hypothetical protein
MPGRRPLGVVLAAWPAGRGHVGLHQLLHHQQPSTHGEGEESLAHVRGDLVQGNAHRSATASALVSNSFV